LPRTFLSCSETSLVLGASLPSPRRSFTELTYSARDGVVNYNIRYKMANKLYL
jgi:hypothetical protein